MSEQTFTFAGHTVNRIGYGAMQLPGPRVWGPPRDRDQALAVLRRAIELGVNHIDTAQFYGPDVANELIREALYPYPDDLLLVTKVGAGRDADGGWTSEQRPEQLVAQVEANLRTLDVERLGAVNLRLADGGSDQLPPDQRVPLADQLGVLVELQSQGKIGGIGLSTIPLDVLEAGLAITDIVCVQNAFSLVEQSDRPVIEATLARGIAYVPYFPLGSAFPGAQRVAEQERVIAVAQRLDVRPAQVGLAWLLSQAPNVLLIPGTSSVSHLEQNLAVGAIELSPEDLAELNG